LIQPLNRVLKFLRTHLAQRQPAITDVPDSNDPSTKEAESAPVLSKGLYSTRQDAIAALDAVASYFRRTEPSSPVQVLIDRAVRLASKSFLEVLQDIAPDGLSQAKLVGGIRDK
jgi:type VI secretion system protein ImpA